MNKLILRFALLLYVLPTTIAYAYLPTVPGGRSGKRGSFISMVSEKMLIKGGSVVALVTPMTKDNKINYEELTSLLKWHAEQGTDGAVILGTTGEASMISLEERTEVIKTAVKAVKGILPIIVGTGTIEASKVIELSKHALEYGADASLVITPYYVKPPQRALVEHFTKIADSVALPMIVYNCPGRTGVDMKPQTVAEFSKHPMIIGIKDATGDLSRVESIRSLCGPDFAIFSGEDDSGMDFVRIGGDGVISVTANIAPRDMHRMLLAAKEGRLQEASEINDRLMLLHQRLFLESNPIPAKKALNLLGKIGPGIRPPLTTLSSDHIVALEEAIAKAKLT